MDEGRDDPADAWIAGEAVVDEPPLAALVNEAGEAERSKLVARGRFRSGDDERKVAHAQARIVLGLAGREGREDPQAGRVREERGGLHRAMDGLLAGDAGLRRAHRVRVDDLDVAPIFAGVRARSACLI